MGPPSPPDSQQRNAMIDAILLVLQERGLDRSASFLVELIRQGHLTFAEPDLLTLTTTGVRLKTVLAYH